ncbi:MAG: CRTAC1 family protein, partial [Acidobacteria bacterium]|nr:CRTAC1 family protein [Acidobacteriota bacterium]
VDNDGWPDMYLGTGAPDLAMLVPNRMFRNAGGKVFQDITTAAGVGHLQKGHGVAFGDLDNDGDQDIYEGMGGAYTGDAYWSVLFLNPGNRNRRITLQLEGVRSNRSAIGARIRIRVQTPAGERDIHAGVSTGGSFGGSSLQQEIGLGDAKAIREIEIAWPASGTRQIFKSVEMDQILKIKEDASEPVPVKLKRLDLAGGKPAGEHRHHEKPR